MRKARLAFLFLLFATVASAQQNGAVDFKAVDRIMNGALRAWQIPGAAIAIVKNDRVVYIKGYGNKEAGVVDPVGPDTLFQIASTSKAFTTAAMAILADEKKLSFDDPVKKHIPYFRLDDMCADSMVTLRDIVSHRTGLRSHDELWDNTPLTREDVVRSMGAVKATRPFRTAYQYQNIMFITAGEAVAGASGMSWDDFVRQRLFAPLQMSSTVISDEEWEASRDRATGYRWDATRQTVVKQVPIDTTTIGAGGAIKSSARDLGNWIRFQLAEGYFEGKRIVSEENLAQTKKPVTIIALENSTRDSHPESNLFAYGMGWMIQDYRGELLVSHSGSLNGFRTHLDLLPEKQVGFVVLINAGRSRATVALRNSLSDLLLGLPSREWNSYYLMLDNKAEMRAEQQKRDRLAKRMPDTKPTRTLDAYAGTYTNRGYGSATVSVVNDALVLKWNQLTLPLRHWHFDTFHAESEADDVDEQVVFSLDGDGVVKRLTLFGEEFARK